MEHIEAYKTLSINPPFTEDALKSAFREAAMRTHPDRGGDAAQFREVKEAYELLELDAGKDVRVHVINDEATIDGILLQTLGLKGKNLAQCLTCDGKGYISRFDDGRSDLSFSEYYDWVMETLRKGINPAKACPNPRYIHFVCHKCNGTGARSIFNPLFQASSIPQKMSQKERKRQGSQR